MMRGIAVWSAISRGIGTVVLAFTVCAAAGVASADGEPAPPFRHGINITRLFDSATGRKLPGTTAIFAPWTREISPAELQRLRAAGFDFIRLPIDPGVLLSADAGQRQQALGEISNFLAAAMQAGFAVIVDLHPLPQDRNWSPSRIRDAPDGPNFSRYTALAEQFAAQLSAMHSKRVALELMNEPQRACVKTSGDDWSVFQAQLYSALRQAAPLLPLVVTGGCNSSIDGLADLNNIPAGDKNLFVMVHFYEPFQFTHQGAAWSPFVKYLAGLRYPVRDGDRDAVKTKTKEWIERHGPSGPASDAAWGQARSQLRNYFATPYTQTTLAKRFDIVARWADQMKIPRDHIVVGEFGVLDEGGGLGTSPGAEAARDQWLHDVASAASQRGFGWAIWGYHGAFGIVSEDPSRTLDPGVLRALFGR